MGLIEDLNKLRSFLHGAHMATENTLCSEVLHNACHQVDNIILNLLSVPEHNHS